MKIPDGVKGNTENTIAAIAEDRTERTSDTCLTAKTDTVEIQSSVLSINFSAVAVAVELTSFVRDMSLEIVGVTEELVVLIRLKDLARVAVADESADNIRKNTLTKARSAADVDKAERVFGISFIKYATAVDRTLKV